MTNKKFERTRNCFQCWHARRIDGMNGCVVCMAHAAKSSPPELIFKPYRGYCGDFYEKAIEEGRDVSDLLPDEEGDE